MKSFVVAFVALPVAFTAEASALTTIASGSYGAGDSVFETGSISLTSGRYRFYLDFTASPLFQDSEISKETTTNFFCVDRDVQSGEFACGGDNVPTLTPFTTISASRYAADVVVNPLTNTPFSSFPIIRYEEFDTCCGYEVEFEAANAGRWTLSFNAVPEPASWLLMIVGFGAVVGALRIRNTRKPLGISG